MTDRKYLPIEERLAAAAEVVEMLLDENKSQPAVARELGFSQPTIGKAIRGDIGPFVKEAILRVRHTTIEELKRKHAGVLAGTAEMPWARWERAERKQGSRVDLGKPAPTSDQDLSGFARELGLEPGAAPVSTPSTIASAVSYMRDEGWSDPDIDFIRSRATAVDPRAATDWRFLVGTWEEALRASGRCPSRSGEHAKSQLPVPPKKDRRGQR